MSPRISADNLRKMIEKAIEDSEITVSEYEEILQLASEDHTIDRQERSLLQSLQSMIENGLVKRVPDRK